LIYSFDKDYKGKKVLFNKENGSIFAIVFNF